MSYYGAKIQYIIQCLTCERYWNHGVKIKGLGCIVTQNTINIHRLKIMTVESLPYKNIACLGWCSFWEMSKTMSRKYCSSPEKKYFRDLAYFPHFSKTTTPQQVIFWKKLSTIIIFKLCEFDVNLWTLCFVSYTKSTQTL